VAFFFFLNMDGLVLVGSWQLLMILLSASLQLVARGARHCYSACSRNGERGQYQRRQGTRRWCGCTTAFKRIGAVCHHLKTAASDQAAIRRAAIVQA
jgi:hypothetical protein